MQALRHTSPCSFTKKWLLHLSLLWLCKKIQSSYFLPKLFLELHQWRLHWEQTAFDGESCMRWIWSWPIPSLRSVPLWFYKISKISKIPFTHFWINRIFSSTQFQIICNGSDSFPGSRNVFFMCQIKHFVFLDVFTSVLYFWPRINYHPTPPSPLTFENFSLLCSSTKYLEILLAPPFK